jgi:hypothetical protein
VASPKTKIQKLFPRLGHKQFEITSSPDIRYNCIAWAAEKSNRFWWPVPGVGYFWPDGFPKVVTVQNFENVFATLGYQPCGNNFTLEPGYDKVALYIDPTTSRPTHMARQLPDGTWTSKLGRLEDIAHRTLEGLEGPCAPNGQAYGVRHLAMKRTVQALPSPPPPASAQPTSPSQPDANAPGTGATSPHPGTSPSSQN